MYDYLKHPKTSLGAKKLNDAKFPPSLKPDVFNGNPQLFVLTGLGKETDNTYIRAGLEPKTADLICEAITYIADLPADPENNITATFECKQGKEKELVAKVVVGKAKNGRMFISLINAKKSDAPMIQFFFGSDWYHPVVWKNTPAETDADALTSCLAAKGWAARTRMYFHTALTQYVPETKDDNKKGNGGWKKDNNKSYSKSEDSYSSVDDDDIW